MLFIFSCLKSTDFTNTSLTDDGMQSLRCFQFKSHMDFKIGKSYKTHPLVFSFIRLLGWLRSSSLGCLFAELPARALVMLMLLMVAHLVPVPCHWWEWNRPWELKTLNHGLFSGPAFCQSFSEFLLKFLVLACGPFLVSSIFSIVLMPILFTEVMVLGLAASWEGFTAEDHSWCVPQTPLFLRSLQQPPKVLILYHHVNLNIFFESATHSETESHCISQACLKLSM